MRFWELFEMTARPDNGVLTEGDIHIFGMSIPYWRTSDYPQVLILGSDAGDEAKVHRAASGKFEADINNSYDIITDTVEELEAKLTKLGITQFIGYDNE